MKSATDPADYKLGIEEIGRFDMTKIKHPKAAAAAPAPQLPVVVAAVSPELTPEAQTKSLTACIQEYIKHRATKKLNHETEEGRAYALHSFNRWHQTLQKQVSGRERDLPIGLITKSTMVAFRTSLEEEGLSPKRISTLGSFIGVFFRHQQDDGVFPETRPLPTTNVFKFTEKDRLASADAGFRAYTTEELQLIFDNVKRSAPDFYLIPMICLFTGVRREEVCWCALKIDQRMEPTKADLSDRPTRSSHLALLADGSLQYFQFLCHVGC